MGLPSGSTRQVSPLSEEPSTGDRTAAVDGGDGKDDPPCQPLAEGTIVGRYVISRKLGEGGMGVVYRAYDPRLDRSIALKLVRGRPGDSAEKADAQLRLLREAQALAKLSHPNVVGIHDTGTFGDQVFLAMELVEGTTFDDWQRERSPGWVEMVGVLMQAGRGLDAAHHAGLVHRDLKPGNVMVDTAGTARVLDFGLAHLAGETVPKPDSSDDAGVAKPTSLLASAVTERGTVLGTPRYMAPEQYQGAPADARSDQFSFCVTAYEAIFGVRPFKGRGSVLRRNIERGSIAVPRKTLTPRRLHGVITRGLRAQPQDRYSDMSALIGAMEEVCDRSRSRRTRTVGTVLLAGLGGFAAAAYRPSDPGPCDQLQPLGEVWNLDVSKTVESSFETTRMPYAAHASTVVTRRLDDYVERWTSIRAAACEQTTGFGGAAPTPPAAQLQCLGRQRTALRMLIQRFVEADSLTVQHGVAAVQALPSIEACADVDALAMSVPPPDDPLIAVRVAALRHDQAQLATMIHTGHFEEASEHAIQFETAAREVGYAPLLAEALFDTAQVRMKLSQLEGSTTAALEAVELGYGTGHDGVVVDALGVLVFVYGLKGEFEHAEHWEALGRGALNRLDAGPLRRAYLGINGAAVATARRDFVRSELLLEGALETLRATDPDHVNVANALNNLATAYSEQGRHAEARTQIEAALAIRLELFGDSHPAVAMSYINLGVEDLALADLRSADANEHRAEQILQALDPDQFLMAIVRINQADIAQARGRLTEAVERSRDARRLLRGTVGERHPFWALPLQTEGDCFRRMGKLEESRERLEASRSHLQTLHPDDPTADLDLRLELAHLRADEGHPEEALTEAIDIHKLAFAQWGPDDPRQGPYEAGLGELALRVERYGLARRYLEQALDRRAEQHGEAQILLPVLTDLADLYSAQGDRVATMNAVERARPLLDGLFTDPLLFARLHLAEARVSTGPEGLRSAARAAKLLTTAEERRPEALDEARLRAAGDR